MLFDILGLSHIYSNDIHTHNIFACVSYSQLMNIFCRELTSVGQLKSVRVHFAYGSDGRSFFVEYS